VSKKKEVLDHAAQLIYFLEKRLIPGTHFVLLSLSLQCSHRDDFIHPLRELIKDKRPFNQHYACPEEKALNRDYKDGFDTFNSWSAKRWKIYVV